MSAVVLVVDDEPDMESLFRQQFRRDLRAGRLDLAFVTTGEGALAIVEQPVGRDIVLVLSDVNMPGMSGLDLLLRVKAARPDLPVIMITAYGDAETRRRSLLGGAEGVLPKPLDFAVLRTEVQRRIGGVGGQP